MTLGNVMVVTPRVVRLASKILREFWYSATRAEEITPNRLLASANQLADNAASIGIGTHGNILNREALFISPENISSNSELRFYLSHYGRTFEKDTSATVRGYFNDELQIRASNKGAQGLLFRLRKCCPRVTQLLSNYGTYRRVLTHTDTSHTRSIKKNKAFREASIAATDEYLQRNNRAAEIVPDALEKANKGVAPIVYNQCSLCQHYGEDQRRYGSLGHFAKNRVYFYFRIFLFYLF